MSRAYNVYKFVREKQKGMSRREFMKKSAATGLSFTLVGKVAVDRIPNVKSGESRIVVPDGFSISPDIDIRRGGGVLTTDVVLTNDTDTTYQRLDYTYTLMGSGIDGGKTKVEDSIPKSFAPGAEGEVSFTVDISERVEAVLDDGLDSFVLEITPVSVE